MPIVELESLVGHGGEKSSSGEQLARRRGWMQAQRCDSLSGRNKEEDLSLVVKDGGEGVSGLEKNGERRKKREERRKQTARHRESRYREVGD